MKGWNVLTQILDFRIVINNKKSVLTGRAAAAAPLSDHSDLDMSLTIRLIELRCHANESATHIKMKAPDDRGDQ